MDIKKLNHITIRFNQEDKKTLDKLNYLKDLFNEKTYSKTIKKIIDSYPINK